MFTPAKVTLKHVRTVKQKTVYLHYLQTYITSNVAYRQMNDPGLCLGAILNALKAVQPRTRCLDCFINMYACLLFLKISFGS